MRMEDDVDAPDSVDLDSDVDMERDGEDEQHEEEEDEKEVVVVDEDEEEDEDEDNGKEPQTIGQGEMVNTPADNADTAVDDQPTMLAEQGQEMREHTPRPQLPAPALLPRTLKPRPQPRTPETNTLSGLEFSELLTPQKPRPATQSLREADAAGNILNVDVEEQLLGESAVGNILPDDPLPNAPLPDDPLPDVPHPEVCPDDSVGEE
jgi:hypothetical protein